VPPGPALPALLTNILAELDGSIRFDLLSQADRRYEIQRSTNLIAWQVLETLLATNEVCSFTDTASLPTTHRYYRALTGD
jgi:hypothetical protein